MAFKSEFDPMQAALPHRCHSSFDEDKFDCHGVDFINWKRNSCLNINKKYQKKACQYWTESRWAEIRKKELQSVQEIVVISNNKSDST